MSTLAPQQFELQAPSDAPAQPTGIGPDDLHELMQTFTETSRQLQETHVTLQKELARLQLELADANAQLQRSKSLAALGGMAAGIAHEIRNPLGSIQLYVQMLQEDLEELPDQAQLCGKIGRAVSSLDAIVGDVLVFARELRVSPSLMIVGEFFERSLEGCTALIEKGAIEVKLEGDITLPLHADEILLGQAFGNIIRNAAEAMMEWKRHEDNDRTLTLS
ncbi:MAG: hypothetical protein O7G85_08975, partial [Planctomycetota bacterium]|nr:hypothetical protein [Planctomycetota bacterium]